MESPENRITIKPMSVPVRCVMIIESDAGIASMLQAVLHEEGIPTMVAKTMHDALQVTKGLQPLLFLINACLSDGDGIELRKQILQRREQRNIPTIILGTNMKTRKQQVEERNVVELEIPLEIDDLMQTIALLLPTQFL